MPQHSNTAKKSLKPQLGLAGVKAFPELGNKINNAQWQDGIVYQFPAEEN